MGVGCEACHGPGAAHVDARQRGARGSVGGTAIPSCCSRPAAAATAGVSSARPGRRETPFLDAFEPELFDTDAYYPDGQVHEELYELDLVPVEPHVRRGRALLELPRRPRQRHAQAGQRAVPELPRGPSTRRRRTRITRRQRRRAVHRLSHAGHRLHAARPAPRPLLRPAGSRAHAGARHPERLQPLSRRPRRRLGGRARPGLVSGRRGARAAPRGGDGHRRRAPRRPRQRARRCSRCSRATRDAVRRASAARLLARFPTSSGVTPALLAAMRDPEPLVRTGAAWSIAQRPSLAPDAREVLVAALDDPVLTVRLHAAVGLRERRRRHAAARGRAGARPRRRRVAHQPGARRRHAGGALQPRHRARVQPAAPRRRSASTARRSGSGRAPSRRVTTSPCCWRSRAAPPRPRTSSRR